MNTGKFILLIMLGAGALAQPVQAQITVAPRAAERANDPPEILEVETPYYQFEFNLKWVGAAAKMIFKPLKMDLRAANYFSNPNYMFRDGVRLVDPNPETGFTEGGMELKVEGRFPASYKVVSQSRDELVLEFEVFYPPTKGVTWADKIINRRRLTLRADTPLIRAENTIANTDTQARPIVFDLYEGLSLGRVDTACSLFGPAGKLTSLDRAQAPSSKHLSAPVGAGDWLGGLNTQGIGGAFSVDWADVDSMAISMSRELGAAYIVNMRNRTIPAGGTVTFQYTFMPFTGFGALDGMKGDLVGGIQVGDKPIFPDDIAWAELKPDTTVPLKLFLASGTNRAVTIALQCIRKEDGLVVLNETLKAELKTAETTVLASRIPFGADGLYVLTATVTNAGGISLRMEKWVTIGKSKLQFAATPPSGEKRGRRDAGENAGPGQLDQQFTTIDRTFVTPHLPLAKNHAAGPVNVFFLMPADSTLGHIREIAQRSDMEYEYASVAKIMAPKYTYLDHDLDEFRKQFRNSNSGVLVDIGVDWLRGIPEAQRSEILDRIETGMGLVITVLPETQLQELLGERLSKATAITPSPINECAVSLPEIKYYAFGKGRIAMIPCPWDIRLDAGEAALGRWTHLAVAGKRAPVPIEGMQWRGFEYSYASLGELIRWAARREGVTSIARSSLDGSNAIVTVRNTGKPVRVTLAVNARSPRWRVQAVGRTTVDLPAGESVQTIPLTPAPGDGWLALEISVYNDAGKLLTFSSTGAGAELPVKISFEGKSIYRTAGKVEPLGIDLAGAVSGGVLQVEITDRFGRVVLRETRDVSLAGNKGRTELDLSTVRPLDIYHEVHAAFQASNRLMAEVSAELFFVPARPDFAERFMIGADGSARQLVLHLQAVLPALRSAGILLHDKSYDDAALFVSGGSRSAAALTGLGLGCSSRYALPGEKPGIDAEKRSMTPPLLPSPDAVQAFKTRWQAEARKAYRAGTRNIMIDDERRMPQDLDCNPQTLAGFREWLKRRYASFADLNATWGKTFADFSAVVPMTQAELGTSENLAPWLEFRMFIGDVLGEYYMKLPSEWAAEISPDLSVGEFGIYEPGLDYTVDWSRYAKYYRYTQRYGNTQGMLEELFRCFGEGARHGQWLGYGMQKIDPGRRVQPWLSLLNGGNYCWFWSIQAPSAQGYAVVGSDQRLTAGYAALARDEFPDLTGGVDRMLIASSFTEDGIGIGYSYPSWVANSTALGAGSKLLVEELGFQHRLVNLEGITAANLEKSMIRVLVIQEASCISREQAKVLRDFVEKGGTLLCVGKLGWRDLHGRPHEGPGAMDELAGVSMRQLKSLNREFQVKDTGGLLNMIVHSDGVQLAADTVVIASAELDGKPLPVLTHRPAGKGHVYWLNSTLGGHRAVRTSGAAGEISTATSGKQGVRDSYWILFDRIIRNAGISPRCRLFLGDQPLFDTETWYYRTPSGRSLIIGRYLAMDMREPVKVQFAQKGQVYDLRSHKYLGLTDSLQDTFPPGSMKLFAILDYQVAGLDAAVDRAKGKPGETLHGAFTVRSATGTPDLHVLRVTVTDPRGEDLSAYRQTVLAPDGRAGVVLPLALNATPGRYVLKAMDVVSGEKAEAPFDIVP